MCFSASVSYGTAAVLIPTGLYAIRQARRLRAGYIGFALAPILFGIQQALEGRVWQFVDAGQPEGAVPFALAYHFFSHFLWPWWIPLSAYLVETHGGRRQFFLGLFGFGFAAGALVYFTALFNLARLSIEVKHHSLVYHVTTTYRPSFDLDLPFPSSVLYGLLVLVPLFFSTHRHLKVFGVLVALSMALTAAAYGYAFVSVWCFFAAVISIYLVMMIRRLASRSAETTPGRPQGQRVR